MERPPERGVPKFNAALTPIGLYEMNPDLYAKELEYQRLSILWEEYRRRTGL